MPSSGVAGFAVPPETRVEAVAPVCEVFESRLCSASLLFFSSSASISASSSRFLAESVSLGFSSSFGGFSAGGSVEKSEVASVPDAAAGAAVVAVVGSGGGSVRFLLTGASAVAAGGGGMGSAAGVSAGGGELDAAVGSSGGRPLVGLLRGFSGLIGMCPLVLKVRFPLIKR